MDRSYPIYPLGMDVVMNRFFALKEHRLPPVNLCFGTSAFDSAKFIDPHVLKEQMSTVLSYGNPMGEEGLRTELAAQLSETHGVDISPSRVFITDGASGALAAALITLLQPGDEAVLQRVFFPPYPLLVHMTGATSRLAEMDDNFNVTPASVREVLSPRTAALVINSPGNPFGNVLSRPQLEELTELGVPIVSDEVYSHLAGAGRAASLLEISQDHFVVGSFSKTYAAAGLRIGYLVVPERHVNTVFAIRASLNICPSLPSQILARALLSHHKEIVASHREYISRQRAFFIRLCRIHQLKLVAPPESGIFGIVDCSSIKHMSSLDIAVHLVERFSVSTSPGLDFAKEDPRFLRVNYSAETLSIESGVARLRAFLEDPQMPASVRSMPARTRPPPPLV